MSSDRACEALEAQGFKAPGPKLIEHVMDAIAREEESPVGASASTPSTAHELLADTPELVDRTEGPLTDGTETARLVAGIINEPRALRVRRRRFLDQRTPDTRRPRRANRRRAGKTLLTVAKTANVNKQKAKLNKEIKRGRLLVKSRPTPPLAGFRVVPAAGLGTW
jgi:hypothetical protein